MKKRSLKGLKLNKQSIVVFANQLKGGQGSNSGLQVSCSPALCIVTKEGIICEEIEFPPLEAAPVDNSPAPSDAAANAAADSPAG
jgi:hypothetical protein